MKDKNMIYPLFLLVAGLVLTGLGIVEVVDEFWSGMGSALTVVGALRLLRYHRLNKNAAYREKVEIAETDERNHFIRAKAWSWTGYLFIIISGLGVIIFKLLGNEQLSMASSGAVCLMLVLYWISYFVLKKKY